MQRRPLAREPRATARSISRSTKVARPSARQLELSQAQIQNAFSVSPAAQFNEFAERGEQLQNEVKGKFEDLTGAVDLEANLAKVRAAVESVKSRLTPKAAA